MQEDNIPVRGWKAAPSIPLCTARSRTAWGECCFKDHKPGTNTIFRWCERASRVDGLECTWPGCLCRAAGQQPRFLRDCPPKLQRWAEHFTNVWRSQKKEASEKERLTFPVSSRSSEEEIRWDGEGGWTNLKWTTFKWCMGEWMHLHTLKRCVCVQKWYGM